MKVIDSVWEKINLGVTSKEVIVDVEDSLNDVIKELNNLLEQYIVVKVPSNRPDVILEIQDIGYKYIEDQIKVEHDLHEISRNKILQRLYDSLSYKVMTENDIDVLYDEIDRGMFSTDRITEDPYFSEGLSSKRYKNWIKSLLEKDAFLYVMSYKDKPAGFIILTTDDKETYHSVLGGGYEKFRKSGLGIVQKEQEIVKSLGGKRVVTSVSSNNIGQLKALIANGYVPSKIESVFIKHN